jgi:tetratricopeptide (TPR) repeat protein
VQRLQLGAKILHEDDVGSSSETEEDQVCPVPDHYQEDECDVGPRALRSPVRLDASLLNTESTLLQTILAFNKALIYHENSNLASARELYSTILQSMQGLNVVPSKLLLEIGTRCHNNMGHIGYLNGEEDLARAHFEASLLCAHELSELSRHHRLEYVTVLSNWCRVSWMQGALNENFFHGLREVLRIRTSLLCWDHVDVAAAHYNIAVAEYARHRSEQAVSHLKQYLYIASHRATAKKVELDRIPTLVYLLIIQHEDKEDSLSQELLRGLRTLQDKRQDQGSEGPEVASVLNFVGTILFHQEDFENALVFFQEELRLEECLVDACEDISVSVTCNNIGRILQERGKLKEAIEYYHRALKAEYGDISHDFLSKGGMKEFPAFKSGKVTENPTSANLYSTVWYNLGLIYDKLGSYGAAIGAFEMSLVFRKSMLGSDHPDVACLLYNIGVLQMEQQELTEASVSFREALRIRQQGATGQLNDKHVIKTLEKLSSLHKAKGNIKGALEAALAVLHIQESSIDYSYTTRMREVGVTLRSIAELHHANGILNQALEMAYASVTKLRLVADVLLSDSLIDRIDQNSNIEQLVTSLLLVGSLHHEMCDPLRASTVLGEAAIVIQRASSRNDDPSVPAFFNALREVTFMLATPHCAAQA